MKKFSRGFTLIELLVVIAIIGILSSVVLASLNTARQKGANAAIKETLDNMRSQAELIYDSAAGGYSYGNVCADTANIQKAMQVAGTAAGSLAPLNVTATVAGTGTVAGDPTNVVTCHSSANAWAIESPLKTLDGANNFWCVDNQGVSRGEPGTTLTGSGAQQYACL